MAETFDELHVRPHAMLPTRHGQFEILGFESTRTNEKVVALVRGTVSSVVTPLVRLHSQCLTGDTFHSLRCDCGEQLEQSLSAIEESDCGVVLYQMQEGRGIGIMNKLLAYGLQDKGLDTVEANLRLGFLADERSYEFCAEVLQSLGVKRVRLLSNNPEKVRSLERAGIRVVQRVPLLIRPCAFSERYLRAKKERMGHFLD